MHWNIWSLLAKGFGNGPIACNALEHMESSGTKGLGMDLLHAMHRNIWSLLVLKVLGMDLLHVMHWNIWSLLVLMVLGMGLLVMQFGEPRNVDHRR